MQAIYEPKGKAREYCERAVNLYRGCSHGCEYCYAPGAVRLKREVFDLMQPRPGVLEAIAKDAPKHAGREVLICFTTDPYGPGYDPDVTRGAIQALQAGGCKVVVLTKGAIHARRDLHLLRPGIDSIGSSLTFVKDEDSMQWEPNAPLPAERLQTLSMAHRLGIHTWASLEPVIDPEQSLALIQATEGCVDFLKIGKWNHDVRAKEIDWADFARRAVDLCKSTGRAYMLKDDLKRYL